MSDEYQCRRDELGRTCTSVDLAEAGIGAGVEVLGTLLGHDEDAGSRRGDPTPLTSVLPTIGLLIVANIDA